MSVRRVSCVDCDDFGGNVLEIIVTEKYYRECNLFVAFLFVLPVFGALLWAKMLL